MNVNEEKKKHFIHYYKQLCADHGMYIGVTCGEGSCGDIHLDIETALSPDELFEHFKEIDETS